MTAEEAKEIMSKVTFYWELGEQTLTQNQINEALDMAIKALEQQPCEDCISREATIEAIYKKYIGGKDAIENAPINDLYADGLAEAVDAVWDMPSVTPTRPTGKWEYVQYDYNPNIGNWHCSECRFMFVMSGVPEYKYCPNCGAKMEEVEE